MGQRPPASQGGGEVSEGRPWWSPVPLLQLITLSGSAQMVTSFETKGTLLSAYMAGALAVMVAVYTAGGVSGEAGEGVPAPAVPQLHIPQDPPLPALLPALLQGPT